MPGTGILFISCLLLWIYLCERQEVNLCPAPIQLRVQNTLIVKLNAALALLAIPQSLSLVCYFIYFVLNFETSHHSSLLNFAYYALFACFYAFNTIQFFLVLLPICFTIPPKSVLDVPPEITGWVVKFHHLGIAQEFIRCTFGE